MIKNLTEQTKQSHQCPGGIWHNLLFLHLHYRGSSGFTIFFINSQSSWLSWVFSWHCGL